MKELLKSREDESKLKGLIYESKEERMMKSSECEAFNVTDQMVYMQKELLNIDDYFNIYQNTENIRGIREDLETEEEVPRMMQANRVLGSVRQITDYEKIFYANSE